MSLAEDVRPWPTAHSSRAMRWLKRLFSGEMAYAGYIMSWAYGDTWSHIGPVSVHMIFVGFSLVYLFALVVTHRTKLAYSSRYPLMLYAAFMGYAILSYLWSPAPNQALVRLSDLLASVPAFVLGLAIVETEERIFRFQVGLILFGILGLAHIISEVLHPTVQFLQTYVNGSESYQGLNRMLGMGAIALACAMYLYPHRWYLRAIAWLGIGGLLALMSVIGGVGGVVGLLLCLFALLMTRTKTIAGSRLLVGQSPIVIAVFFLIIVGVVIFISTADTHELPRAATRLLARLNSLQSAGGSNIYILWDRPFLWRKSIDIWGMSPIFGNGLAAWSTLAGGPDLKGLYAHDIFLEILGDFGMVGFFIFVPLVALLLHGTWKNRKRIPPASWMFIVLLAAFSAFHALVEGNLGANFTHAALAWLFIGFQFRQEEHETKR